MYFQINLQSKNKHFYFNILGVVATLPGLAKDGSIGLYHFIGTPFTTFSAVVVIDGVVDAVFGCVVEDEAGVFLEFTDNPLAEIKQIPSFNFDLC